MVLAVLLFRLCTLHYVGVPTRLEWPVSALTNTNEHVQWSPHVSCPRLDVVYLWVDGSEPEYRARRQAFKQSLLKKTTCAKNKTTASCSSLSSATQPTGSPWVVGDDSHKRTADHGELYFSVRCTIAAMGRMLGRIYVVTDGQTPSWYEQQPQAFPQVTIVNQNQLLPTSLQPSYNSDVISAYLHRIPGLSEWYLFMNDDFFMGKLMTPQHFFTSVGVGRFHQDGWGFSPGWARALTLGLEPTASARVFTDRRLKAHGIKGYHSLPAHSPMVFHRPTVEQAMEKTTLGTEFAEHMRGHHFRQPDDWVMASFYLLHYQVAKGKLAVSNDLNCAYLFYSNWPNLNALQVARIERACLKKRTDFFVINDSSSATGDLALRLERTIWGFMDRHTRQLEAQAREHQQQLKHNHTCSSQAGKWSDQQQNRVFVRTELAA